MIQAIRAAFNDQFTDSKYQKQCHQAASLVASFLESLDFEIEIHEENKNYLIFSENSIL